MEGGGAVAAAWTRRGPATLLTELFMQQAGADSPERLLEGLSQGELSLGPDAAPLVFQAADAGDAVAAECLTWSGREVGSLAVGVIRQLGFEALSFEVVLVGSMHNGGPRVLRADARDDPRGGAGRAFRPADRAAGGRRRAAGDGDGGVGRPSIAPPADRLNANAPGRVKLIIRSTNHRDSPPLARAGSLCAVQVGIQVGSGEPAPSYA